MANIISKAALNNLEDIKIYFDEYAVKGRASETGCPYWSLYQGEDTKAPRCGYNWHISDPVKSWELLKLNLAPYEKTGGTFYLTMSDKPKDNAPSSSKLIDFNAYRNQAQQTGVNGINGIFTAGGGIGDINKAIQDGIKMAMLEKELQDYKNGTVNKGIGAILTPIMSHPQFNPNVLVSGLFSVINGLMNKGQMVTNGVPQYTVETVQQGQQQQGQSEEQTEYYEYNNDELLKGLEKIRAKVKGVKTEYIIDKVGDLITNLQPYELAGLLSQLGVNMDLETGICSLMNESKKV